MRRLLVLCALVPAPAFAQAPAPLCGIDAAGIAAIRARVAADPRYKRDGGDALREIWSAESIQSIWTFTTPRNPVYPAALCEQVAETEGAMRIDRHHLCEAGPGACATFAAEIEARDDGSGDGE